MAAMIVNVDDIDEVVVCLMRRKRMLQYHRGEKGPLSYTVHTGKDVIVHTPLDDTVNTAKAGDVIMTGPLGERYVVKAARFLTLYTVDVDTGIATPKPDTRQVACVTSAVLDVLRACTGAIRFSAQWGELMTAHEGDYLVRQVDDKTGAVSFYSIAKAAFESTYV